MRATIKTCVGTENLLYYNEKKIGRNQAQCIYAGNFVQDVADISPREKRKIFRERIELNQRPFSSGISLLLEFAPGKTLDQDTLIDISWDFMRDIGYGSQPYLVYRHDDTAYQHLHIITTNIQHDGARIPDHYFGEYVMQPVRQTIMEKYGLDNRPPASLQRHDPREKIQYGKTFTRQAIADTLQYVLDNYHYRSLGELNAALRLYNLKVISGKPDSWLYRNRGLMYQITNEHGKAMNAPIKASDFDFKPTLDNLEQRFTQHILPPSEASRPRRTLDDAIRNTPANADQFTDLLRRDRLATVPFHDRQGTLNDLFFVDLATKWVLSPGDLGRPYDPATIRQTLGFDPFVKPAQEKKQQRIMTQQPKRNRHL
jgi:hypothetical protein